MSKQVRNTHVYCVKNKDGFYVKYSSGFKSRREALEWYSKYGKKLEKLVNRKMRLTETKE